VCIKTHSKTGLFALGILALSSLILESSPLGREEFAQAQNADDVTVTQTHVITYTDSFPRFANPPTITSARGGSWNDPTMWKENRIPGAGDKVAIDDGHVVQYDSVSDAAITAIEVRGSLIFATTQNTRLTVGTLMVMPQGKLEVGTPARPVPTGVQAEIVIAALPLDTGTVAQPGSDLKQYGNSIIGLGTISMHGAPMGKTFIRIAVDPKAGDSALTLLSPPTGWNVGDHLMIPDTRQDTQLEKNPQFENVTIASIAGNRVTLASPLSFDHIGSYLPDGTTVTGYQGEPLKAHAVNISRNVIVRSADTAWHAEMDAGKNPLPADDRRGHVLFNNRAAVDIRYVHFDHLGRTDGGFMDSTTFDAAGNPTKIGINQIGRYAVHFHHVTGPVNPGNTGYQFVAEGISVTNFKKWGITVHQTHYGLLTKNVMVGNTDPANIGLQGAGLAFEDGTESFNTVTENFSGLLKGTGDPQYEDWPQKRGGVAASGFWFNGPNDGGEFSRNVAADNMLSTNTSGVTMIFTRTASQIDSRPLFRGAHPMRPGEYETMSVRSLPVHIHDTEVYAVGQAVHLWDVTPQPPKNPALPWDIALADSVSRKLERIDVWNNSAFGIEVVFGANLLIDQLRMIGNGTPIQGINGGIDLEVSHAMNPTIRNSIIIGQRVGILLPSIVSAPTDGTIPGVTRIENTYLENVENITERTIFSKYPFQNALLTYRLPPADAIITDTVFTPYKFPKQQNVPSHAVSMDYDPAPYTFKCPPDGSAHLTQSQRVYIKNYNREQGRNLQIFYREQAPDFIVPQSADCRIGSPETGLTNLQNWQKYTIAIAGTVAPCTTILPEFKGFVCPWDGVTIPPPPESNAPTLLINNPIVGSTVAAQAITVTYRISGNNVASGTHPHFQLDTQPEVMDTDADGTYTFTNVARGNHTLKGYLARSDHTKMPGTTRLIPFSTTASSTASSGNRAPTVNAGADQTVTLPASANLDGTVSDDNLPNPPGRVTTTWTKVSGPGTVTFGSTSAIDTTASFSVAGTYVLRLTASDSALSGSDTIQITVNAAPVGGGGTACVTLNLPAWKAGKWPVDVEVSLRKTGDTVFTLTNVPVTTDAAGTACFTAPASVLDSIPYDFHVKVPGHLRVKASGITNFFQSGMKVSLPTSPIGDADGDGTVKVGDIVTLIRAYVAPSQEPILTKVLSGTAGQRFLFSLLIDAITSFRNGVIDQ
jgi:hypothetical protein